MLALLLVAGAVNQGQTPTPDDKLRQLVIDRLLEREIAGVQEIKNEVRTLPTSRFDDELRYAVARQIYGDPLFWNYAIQVNPPIHIIVEHGAVTLTGVVNSEVERRKAEMVARTTFSVMSVTNKLQVERD